METDQATDAATRGSALSEGLGQHAMNLEVKA